MSNIVKVIGHTSSRDAVVNMKNFHYYKFLKNSNCSKTSIVKSNVFSEHLKMIILQNPYDFK